jgi:NADH dehydrogenase
MERPTTVVGATGLLGSEICRLFSSRSQPVRALIRPTSTPARVAQLEWSGVELVQGDLKDRASLDAACAGTQAIISTASSTLSRQPGDSIQTVDLEGQLSLIEAARKAGVEHFVFISFAPLQGDLPLQDAKRSVEQQLIRSGMSFTILRPTYFMEVWLSLSLGFDPIQARARIYGSGQAPLHWISVEDVARFAVGALENPRARDAILELGGEDALSQLDVIHEFEEQGGRRFERVYVSEHELRAQLAAATDPLQRSFAGLMLNVALGDQIDPRPAMEAIPIRPRTVRDYARQVMTHHQERGLGLE